MVSTASWTKPLVGEATFPLHTIACEVHVKRPPRSALHSSFLSDQASRKSGSHKSLWLVAAKELRS